MAKSNVPLSLGFITISVEMIRTLTILFYSPSTENSFVYYIYPMTPNKALLSDALEPFRHIQAASEPFVGDKL